MASSRHGRHRGYGLTDRLLDVEACLITYLSTRINTSVGIRGNWVAWQRASGS